MFVSLALRASTLQYPFYSLVSNTVRVRTTEASAKRGAGGGGGFLRWGRSGPTWGTHCAPAGPRARASSAANGGGGGAQAHASRITTGGTAPRDRVCLRNESSLRRNDSREDNGRVKAAAVFGPKKWVRAGSIRCTGLSGHGRDDTGTAIRHEDGLPKLATSWVAASIHFNGSSLK